MTLFFSHIIVSFSQQPLFSSLSSRLPFSSFSLPNSYMFSFFTTVLPFLLQTLSYAYPFFCCFNEEK
ncbi:hypothetical protein MtrunA17_Chr2g0312481 [Medicago truncatula]|uniref:Transmembrane protein n=1 Tax=Medicago truncatula TaxID=3880 RepID=A0A396JBG8_MEDTR|nr:hypothetical protein MtrunA17_Chr2g0312481 [Medicago truncatula]